MSIVYDLLATGQAQKEVTVNKGLITINAQTQGVISRTTTAPPGSPVEGDAYIVPPSGATGVWVGHDDELAFYFGSVWNFLAATIFEGLPVRVVDDDNYVRWDVGTGAYIVIAYAGAVGTAAYLDSDADGTLAANSDLKIATQKATKTYVDAKVAGLSWKQAVRAATTAAGTLATSFENGNTIDGVTLATGDRILVKNQAAGAENGIYVVAASGSPTRATDADSGAELVNASVYVSEGTTLADTQWTCTTNATITVGSTSLAFAQLTSGGGSIGGSTGSTDNAVLRADGTGGATIQATGVIIGDSNELSGYAANVNAQTGTTYTLQASDAGKMVTLSNASAITVTLPNSLSAGFVCSWAQKGAGQVTFTAAGGGTLNNRSGHTKSAGQYALGTLYVDANAGGSAAIYYLGGDTTT